MDWEVASAGLTLVAIIVALILGVQSIRETRNIQKREFRHRLLNEIAEWATKVINWRSENRTATREMAKVEVGDVKSSQRLFHAHIAEIQDFFSAITEPIKYIRKVAFKYQQGLPEDIQKLMDGLKVYTDFLETWKHKLVSDITKAMSDIDADAATADKLAEQVVKSADVVLEKVAIIKTGEID